MKTVNELINQFDLMRHPEGGYYKQVYKADLSVDCQQSHGGERSAYTSIYYLLNGNDFSAWHKIKSDESWFFHMGCDLLIYTLDDQGVLRERSIGLSSNDFQCTIKANTWFCAKPVDHLSYVLVSCCVAPGFEFKDFTLATEHDLLSIFPQHEIVIKKFMQAR